MSVLALLLPYIEQDNIYNQMIVPPPNTTATVWWGVAQNWNMAQVKINTYLCPSDNARSRPQVFARLWP
jgi:hypothetical protein